MSKLLRRAWAVFKAYLLTELIRSKSAVFAFLGIALWIVLFTSPTKLFLPFGESLSQMATGMFIGISIFLLYGTATWDWATELRFMINDGRLEYYIASGCGFMPHFIGILPVSLIWVGIALVINYVVLSIIWGSPNLAVNNPPALILGFILLLLNLVSYALILGGFIISSGTSGFIVEILGFVMPVITGGFTPLRTVNEPLRTLALLTPFSYSAEIIRYSTIGIKPALEEPLLEIIGCFYATAFLLVGVAFFNYQLKKVMREGFRATSMW
ncbi:MAG: ABC transporter permease [Desulfurococcaceae archaeon]